MYKALTSICGVLIAPALRSPAVYYSHRTLQTAPGHLRVAQGMLFVAVKFCFGVSAAATCYHPPELSTHAAKILAVRGLQADCPPQPHQRGLKRGLSAS